MEVDFIIVGQGIAGTVLADHLIQCGKRVLVFDEPGLSNSSKVAGGLYNPVTGRKMVKTWLADDLFPYLLDYYRDLQNRLSSRFLIETPIYRPFLSIEEQNEWMGKSSEVTYKPYVKRVFDQSGYGDHIKDEYGGLLLDQSGYVDTALMVDSFRTYLLEEGSLIEQVFDDSRLEFSEDGVRYLGHTADKVIFSDGPLLTRNKFFHWLPMRPVKGELIFIKVQEDFKAIYNRGVFIIPLGGGICKVGATYDHQNLDNEATEKAKAQLIEKLSGLIKLPFEVVNQVAGIRPATKDRRPLLGVHPENERIAVFGGLGAKGVSLAPYFGKQFVEYLTNENELPEAANIKRFFSLY